MVFDYELMVLNDQIMYLMLIIDQNDKLNLYLNL